MQLGDNVDLVRELVGMVEYAVEYGYFQAHRDLERSRKVDPESPHVGGLLAQDELAGPACLTHRVAHRSGLRA
jgi:hypothetical protein